MVCEMHKVFKPAMTLLARSVPKIDAMRQVLEMVDVYLMTIEQVYDGDIRRKKLQVLQFILDVCLTLGDHECWALAESTTRLKDISPEVWEARNRTLRRGASKPVLTSSETDMQAFRINQSFEAQGMTPPTHPETSRLLAVKLQQKALALLNEEKYSKANEANEAALLHLAQLSEPPQETLIICRNLRTPIQLGSAMKNASAANGAQVLQLVLQIIKQLPVPLPIFLVKRFLILSSVNDEHMKCGEELGKVLELKINDKTTKATWRTQAVFCRFVIQNLNASRYFFPPNKVEAQWIAHPDMLPEDLVSSEVMHTVVRSVGSTLADSLSVAPEAWDAAIDVLFVVERLGWIRNVCGMLAGMVTTLDESMLLPTSHGAFAIFFDPKCVAAFWPQSERCKTLASTLETSATPSTTLQSSSLPLLLDFLRKLYNKAVQQSTEEHAQLVLGLADIEHALGQWKTAYWRYFEDYVTVTFMAQLLYPDGDRAQAFEALTKAWGGGRVSLTAVTDAIFLDEEGKPASCFWDLSILEFLADQFRRRGNPELVSLVSQALRRDELSHEATEETPPHTGKTTGLFYDPLMLKHVNLFETGKSNYPEVPERIKCAYEMLIDLGLENQCQRIKITGTTFSEKDLRLAHADQHVKKMESLADHFKGLRRDELKRWEEEYVDVYFSNDSPECAKVACAGAIAVSEAVWTNKVTNGIALIR
ncbi:Histone deacetylase 6 [Rhizophlyctis rosea]|nr:Histone deacetylase 6 [Rhizophlyctis rosea]